MRANLVSPSSAHLSYAIRDIVKFGELVRQHGVEITWENIGDPIAKGETVAPWIREILHEVVEIDDSWGYCPTEGFLEAREALAAHVNARAGRPGHGRRHHLLQRRGRRGGQGLRLLESSRAGHRSLARLQHPFVGRIGALRPAASHLRPRPRQRLAARPRRPAPQDREEPLHRGDPAHQSQQPHRRGLPGGGAGADRRHRPGVRALPGGRRDLHPHGLPGRRHRPPLRGDPRRAGHRHARHIQGAALAGVALRLDRGAQPVARPELLRLRRFAGRGQAAGGLLHQRAAAGRAPRVRRPAVRRAIWPRGRRCTRSGRGRPTRRSGRIPGLKVQPGPGRLLHDGCCSSTAC